MKTSQPTTPFRNSVKSTLDEAEEKELIHQYNEIKNQRKKAEEAAQLIKNRINLLLQEESRTQKEVQETRKKVQQILDQKLQKQLAREKIESV